MFIILKVWIKINYLNLKVDVYVYFGYKEKFYKFFKNVNERVNWYN